MSKGVITLEPLKELEEFIDKIIEEKKRLKKEYDELWDEYNKTVEELERLKEENERLNSQLKDYRATVDTMLKKLKRSAEGEGGEGGETQGHTEAGGEGPGVFHG